MTHQKPIQYRTDSSALPSLSPRPDPDHYDRAMARGRVAAQAVRKRGGSELEAALAQIRATFDDELRADTLAAFKLSAAIASGQAPTMKEVAKVLMSGNLPPGVTDADIDRAAQGPDEWPCQWDEDGYCRTCGAGPDDECEFEDAS